MLVKLCSAEVPGPNTGVCSMSERMSVTFFVRKKYPSRDSNPPPLKHTTLSQPKACQHVVKPVLLTHQLTLSNIITRFLLRYYILAYFSALHQKSGRGATTEVWVFSVKWLTNDVIVTKPNLMLPDTASPCPAKVGWSWTPGRRSWAQTTSAATIADSRMATTTPSLSLTGLIGPILGIKISF